MFRIEFIRNELFCEYRDFRTVEGAEEYRNYISGRPGYSSVSAPQKIEG